jgi:hypothetical protein
MLLAIMLLLSGGFIQQAGRSALARMRSVQHDAPAKAGCKPVIFAGRITALKHHGNRLQFTLETAGKAESFTLDAVDSASLYALLRLDGENLQPGDWQKLKTADQGPLPNLLANVWRCGQQVVRVEFEVREQQALCCD